MPDLVLHPQTAEAIKRLVEQPAQALVLLAPEGAGKQAVAEYAAAQLLATTVPGLSNHAYYKLITLPKDKTTIPIESVRDLQQFGKLKALGNGVRITVIDQAHTMQPEAQNAALKLLEEPPAGMVLMLLAANEQALLPTIRSRVQIVRLHMPAKADVSTYFSDSYSAEEVAQAIRWSGGLPGLTSALLANAKHPLVNAVEQARLLLGAPAVERLGMIDAIGKQREDAIRLSAVLQRMAAGALEAAASKASRPAIEQWHRILSAGYEAEAALRHNAQPKLVLTNLMLSL